MSDLDKMPRFKDSPTCPSCHHYNALLAEWRDEGAVLVCRDCGYSITEAAFRRATQKPATVSKGRQVVVVGLDWQLESVQFYRGYEITMISMSAGNQEYTLDIIFTDQTMQSIVNKFLDRRIHHEVSEQES